MKVFYNDNDKNACAWLRELIKAGLIPDGVVDERSILEIKPEELRDYDQVHLFAGIGGWALALILAGWFEGRKVWTCSCPCQPLSCAGLGKGHADERHLWPAVYGLIAVCRPATIIGEQVASADGREWFAGVRADLEGLGHAVGGADLCAAGKGAPQIRQRLYWVAHTTSGGQRANGSASGSSGHTEQCEQTDGLGDSKEPRLEGHTRNGRVGDQSRREFSESIGSTAGAGKSGDGLDNSLLDGRRSRSGEVSTGRDSVGGSGESGGVADTDGGNKSNGGIQRSGEHRQRPQDSGVNFWNDSIWHPCRDGKVRRIPSEPALFPLAARIPGRVGLLRGAGNAIVPELAAEFIIAFLEAEKEMSAA